MEYTANSIEYIEGLEQIRKRPDMYMGGTTGDNPPALFRCMREIIDNSLDEYLAKYCNKLCIICDTANNVYTVIDNGRGIPTDINKKSGLSALTLVFTKLHAGGKFDHNTYKVSSGKNGVGTKGTNALSKELSVWSNNNSKKTWVSQHFKQGKIASEVKSEKLPENIKKYATNGTVVQFSPDPEIFKDNCKLDTKRLLKELTDIQYLCPKLEIKLIIDDNETILYSENGLVELTNSTSGVENPFIFNNEEMDVAINFTKEESTKFKSFVNICYTDMGGTHLDGLKKALVNVVRENSKKKILAEDILEGVIGAIHFRMAEPQYQGQTKNELTSAEPEKIVIDTLTPALQKYFKKNKELLNRIVVYAEKMLEQKEKMKADKDMLKGLNTLNKAARKISDKFLDADRRKYKDPSQLEMFIVEGDSAGGHFSRSRESFQAELKIRGKIINAEKASVEELFGKKTKKNEKEQSGNREIKDLVAALGCGINNDYNEANLRFGKVIILSDSDTDGMHIQCLVLSFFVNYMPDLIKNGHVYIIDAPLFIASSSKYKVYGMTRAEIDNKMKKLHVNDYTILRMKGWGETNTEQLYELCLNPDTRNLIQIKWSDTLVETIHNVMGSESNFRKELLGII
ncbi:MAG: hypothetical protein HUJ68_08885 [Clostridia bacterium]|nr:hypothetical protein [Clostridia bacterium]